MRLDGTVLMPLGRLPAPQYSGTIAFEVSIEPVGEFIYVADARRYEVRVLDQTGRLRWLLRSAESARPITDADWRRQAESSVPSGVPAAQRDRQIAMMLSMTRPASWPAFRYVRVDPAHRIWVGDYHDSRIWTVFDANGDLLGQLELPWPSDNDPQLVGLTADYIIVRRTDSDGAPHLSLHRVTLAP
jgi:hypothetical protein